jgi:hypothetical protein
LYRAAIRHPPTEPSVQHQVELMAMIGEPNPALVRELRFALEVMDECSHLGLDDEVARNLRGILLRQIAKAEDALASRPADPLLAQDLEFCE